LTDDLPSAAGADTRPLAHHAGSVRRKRGRPLEMQPHEVIAHIRDLAGRDRLFRVHLDLPSLYARARRLFGNWASALAAAGLDHGAATAAARRRAVEARRRRVRSAR
jgi:hypothetical protein